VIEALRELRDRTLYSGESELAFCHSETGRPLDRSKLIRRFRDATKRAEVRPITFHELRHTFGTRMAASGVPLRTAMKEGLPGGNLRLSSRTNLEEARLHVARWARSKSKED
jgi:integrase